MDKVKFFKNKQKDVKPAYLFKSRPWKIIIGDQNWDSQNSGFIYSKSFINSRGRPTITEANPGSYGKDAKHLTQHSGR
ncbi:MAG: hypothetical protein JWQ14_1402 [Adhaeribacter sp.]|nr:hypothetical protein [Adhaeribacter sp.]